MFYKIPAGYIYARAYFIFLHFLIKWHFPLALGVSTILIVNPITFSFAKSEIVEGRAYNMALQYIENSRNDESWKNNNPSISGQKKFYTDNEKKVSYIEYKISCDSTPDCGFILMNVDGNDVTVPIASPSGNTPSEILDQGENVDEKLYYFGPFDLYSENEQTGDVQALDPQKSVDLRDDSSAKRSSEEKQTNKLARETLKSELKQAKLVAKEFKKSEEFKKQKEEIKDQILNIPKEEFSMRALDFAFADIDTSGGTYTSPGTSDEFIPGISTPNCQSKIPCYGQYYSTYYPPAPAAGVKCYSGCSPTAVAMLMGYYDRNGKDNLISGTAADYTLHDVSSTSYNTTIKSLLTNLQVIMGTTCKSATGVSYYMGSTSRKNVKLAKQYAINQGYIYSTSYYSGIVSSSTVFSGVKTEIDGDRPIIIHVSSSTGAEGHSVVGYGYIKTGTTKIVRMNMGWGNGLTANRDQNLDAVFYSGNNAHTGQGYTTFNIQ